MEHVTIRAGGKSERFQVQIPVDFDIFIVSSFMAPT